MRALSVLANQNAAELNDALWLVGVAEATEKNEWTKVSRVRASSDEFQIILANIPNLRKFSLYPIQNEFEISYMKSL